MTKNTRREMLAKLGAGAAALTTLGVATLAGAQTKDAVVRPPSKAVLAAASRNKVRISPGDTNVQINVGIDKQGLVLVTQRLDAVEPKIGLSSDRKILQLGLKIKGGLVEVTGLDSVLNRGGNVAAEGRCTMRTDPGAAVVLPGENIALKLDGLSKF
jgi:hypothetical protein